MAKVKGAREFKSKLERSMGKIQPEITRALYAGGQIIEIEAEISITEGSISGKNHVPSKPGEPPNADTRLLDTSIHTTVEEANRILVASNAPYGLALEVGTSKMAARPYMGPAARRKTTEVVELVGKAVDIAIRRI